MFITIVSCVFTGFISGSIGFIACTLVQPKRNIDGRIVVTQEDKKITYVLVFDDEEKPIQLRNQQLITFRVEGPSEFSS